MSEDFKKKDSDHQTEGPENRLENKHENRPESKAAREVGSIDSTILNLIAKKRTNSSSGSLDESQDHSLEIDFGGSVESRKNRLPSELLAQAKEPTVFKPMPIPAMEVRRTGDAPAPLADLTAPTDLINSRTELKRLVADKIQSPSERKQFLDDMDHFEANFDQRSSKTATGKLREMADTYAQLSRLLSADTEILAKYPQCQLKEGETPWRVRVAEQIIHQAAEPFTISQGKLAVCAAAALEVREYYREPAAAARLVTDALLTGNYEATAGGTKVDLTKCPDNLIPDPFAKQFTVEKEVKVEKIYVWDVPYLDARSFASQLFEVTAINLALQPRGFRYEQPAPSDYASLENRANAKTVNIRTNEAQPWGSGEKRTFCDADIADSAYKISGKDERHFVLVSAHLSQTEVLDPSLRSIYALANRDQRVISVFLPNELDLVLKKTKELDQWPPIVRLDASRPPISEHGARAHFLVISDYSHDGKLLAFDNTWSENRDRNGKPTVLTSQIAESMFSSGIAQPSQANDYSMLAQYARTHPKEWAERIEKWLQLPNKLNSNGRAITPSEYEKLTPDEELRNWISQHPEDTKLELWYKLLLEWRASYPR
ncbi:MAG: hypothetical protein Q8T09_19760 [Candidatus Melainabacteria bacterium]|nr:hypothetical protein [Candidatus Melainabacteria bacterium]